MRYTFLKILRVDRFKFSQIYSLKVLTCRVRMCNSNCSTRIRTDILELFAKKKIFITRKNECIIVFSASSSISSNISFSIYNSSSVTYFIAFYLPRRTAAPFPGLIYQISFHTLLKSSTYHAYILNINDFVTKMKC